MILIIKFYRFGQYLDLYIQNKKDLEEDDLDNDDNGFNIINTFSVIVNKFQRILNNDENNDDNNYYLFYYFFIIILNITIIYTIFCYNLYI